MNRVPIFLALLDLFNLPQDITYTNGNAGEDLLELDPEETGFQSSFSKLGASEKSGYDPVKDVVDEKLFASKQISGRSGERPGIVRPPNELSDSSSRIAGSDRHV